MTNTIEIVPGSAGPAPWLHYRADGKNHAVEMVWTDEGWSAALPAGAVLVSLIGVEAARDATLSIGTIDPY